VEARRESTDGWPCRRTAGVAGQSVVAESVGGVPVCDAAPAALYGGGCRVRFASAPSNLITGEGPYRGAI
jgi:hypothetical protein